MTYNEFKEAFRELEFLNQGKILNNYEIVVENSFGSQLDISSIKTEAISVDDKKSKVPSCTLSTKIIIKTY